MSKNRQKFIIPTANDLKQLRKEKEMTQKELAELTGVSQSLIARIESGSVNPGISTVRIILSVLYGEDNQNNEISALELCTKNPTFIRNSKTIKDAIDIMSAKGISQIPVVDSTRKIIGSISEKRIMASITKNGRDGLTKLIGDREILEKPFPEVKSKTSIKDIEKILINAQAIIVKKGDGNNYVGIITKSNLLNYFKKLK